uniref:Uncharacterized protein n=1 Tax=Arundo donax TaxID=35708 RepID=A0A0A9D3G6_ARUDO
MIVDTELVPVAGCKEHQYAIQYAPDHPEDLGEEIVPEGLDQRHVEGALLRLGHMVELKDAADGLPDVLGEVVGGGEQGARAGCQRHGAAHRQQRHLQQRPQASGEVVQHEVEGRPQHLRQVHQQSPGGGQAPGEQFAQVAAGGEERTREAGERSSACAVRSRARRLCRHLRRLRRKRMVVPRYWIRVTMSHVSIHPKSGPQMRAAAALSSGTFL